MITEARDAKTGAKRRKHGRSSLLFAMHKILEEKCIELGVVVYMNVYLRGTNHLQKSFDAIFFFFNV